MVESHIDRDSKRAIALSDKKGDRPLRFDMGKAIAMHGYLGK
jgi:hypothetical protein